MPINEEKLLKEVEEELERLDNLSDEQLEALAKEALAQAGGKKQTYLSPVTKMAQKAREKFKRERLVTLRERFKELHLKVKEDGRVDTTDK